MVSLLLRALRAAADKGYENQAVLDLVVRALDTSDPLVPSPPTIFVRWVVSFAARGGSARDGPERRLTPRAPRACAGVQPRAHRVDGDADGRAARCPPPPPPPSY